MLRSKNRPETLDPVNASRVLAVLDNFETACSGSAATVFASATIPENPPVTAIAPQKPVTTTTTVPPVTTPKPAGPSPLATIVLGIAATGVSGAGGFLARRWWIRRQNMALFGEC